ncbi:uncharacterized protein LOC111643691 [Copidosoma floridanum]|uniref:uncharacterized protein LOC111643690 n=1 Tax=Copidosoma floridanum TaxID=29053 RepID=UPI000C6F943D|nr:uncharacterized protein LOC111643690 [Copidosoma floridanum]XP_023247633.1 uncharacterized protein LOC111643691 [Copidosoma floridanum]
MLPHLRRSVWILRGQRLAVGVLHCCAKCTRHAARSPSQLMGQLPTARVSPSRLFSHTGVDFAGPIPVLFSRGRGAKTTKGYIAVFICTVTRAVHLEVASDLSTHAFLAAYFRFTARRGVCAVLYSDNATNFNGAASELQRMLASFLFASNISKKLAAQGTDWSLIPPRAPHFGGLWEAAVRSAKHHLKRVICETRLTFEELSTLCAKIKACLNSRPLCALSNEVTGELALTPAHFLVGSALLSHPEPYDEAQRPMSPSNRWKLLVNLRNSFWSSWRKEVLLQHLKRCKWQTPRTNLQEGDVVW